MFQYRSKRIRLILVVPVVLVVAAPGLAQIPVATTGDEFRVGASNSFSGAIGGSGLGQPTFNFGSGTFGLTGTLNVNGNSLNQVGPFSPDRGFDAQLAPGLQFNGITRDPIGVGNLGFGSAGFAPVGSVVNSAYGSSRINALLPTPNTAIFDPTRLGGQLGSGLPRPPSLETLGSALSPLNVTGNILVQPDLGFGLPTTGSMQWPLSNVFGEANPLLAQLQLNNYEEDLIASSPLFGTPENVLRRRMTATSRLPGQFTNQATDLRNPQPLADLLLRGSIPQYGQNLPEATSAIEAPVSAPGGIQVPALYRGVFGGDSVRRVQYPLPEPPEAEIVRPQVPTVEEFLQSLRNAREERIKALGGETGRPSLPESGGAVTSPINTSRVRPAPPAGLGVVPKFEPSGSMFEDMKASVEWIKSLRGRQEEVADVARNVPELTRSFERAVSFVMDTSKHPLATLAGEGSLPSAKRAEQYLQSGEFYRALAHYEMAQAFDRGNPLLDLGQGHALIGAGEYLSAVLRITRGIERFPEIVHFKFDLRQLITDLDLLDIRRADLDKRLAKEEDYRYRFLLGYIEYYMGLEEFGLEHLEKAAADAPPESIIARFPDLLEKSKLLAEDVSQETPEP